MIRVPCRLSKALWTGRLQAVASIGGQREGVAGVAESLTGGRGRRSPILGPSAMTKSESTRAIATGFARPLSYGPLSVGTGGLPAKGGAPPALPPISIGMPVTWAVQDLLGDDPPAAVRAKMDQLDFFLVRVCCSFRAAGKNTTIEWARFDVALQPDAQNRQPLAFDIHPLQVMTEVKRNVKVSLGPSIKFKEVEANLGSAEFGLEYPELQPVITGTGAGESVASWDYTRTKGLPVLGSKFMHMLVSAPKGMPNGNATIHLEAEVRVAGSILHARLPRTEAAHDGRFAPLWTTFR